MPIPPVQAVVVINSQRRIGRKDEHVIRGKNLRRKENGYFVKKKTSLRLPILSEPSKGRTCASHCF